jgi:hypothetical protein
MHQDWKKSGSSWDCQSGNEIHFVKNAKKVHLKSKFVRVFVAVNVNIM